MSPRAEWMKQQFFDREKEREHCGSVTWAFVIACTEVNTSIVGLGPCLSEPVPRKVAIRLCVTPLSPWQRPVEGEENAIIVYQLNQRRVLPGFAHCQDRMWEGLRWPGLVSPGQGGRNLIQGLAWVTPPNLFFFAALGSSDANREASVLKV